jgi:hypothetical protein
MQFMKQISNSEVTFAGNTVVNTPLNAQTNLEGAWKAAHYGQQPLESAWAESERMGPAMVENRAMEGGKKRGET